MATQAEAADEDHTRPWCTEVKYNVVREKIEAVEAGTLEQIEGMTEWSLRTFTLCWVAAQSLTEQKIKVQRDMTRRMMDFARHVIGYPGSAGMITFLLCLWALQLFPGVRRSV